MEDFTFYYPLSTPPWLDCTINFYQHKAWIKFWPDSEIPDSEEFYFNALSSNPDLQAQLKAALAEVQRLLSTLQPEA
jgi:hypothetical protein